jgi:hypothetical protein
MLVRLAQRWSSARVIEFLADVVVMKGVPEHIRSDNGPEFAAKELRQWLADCEDDRFPTSPTQLTSPRRRPPSL